MRIPQLAAATAAALLLTACGGSPLDGKSGPEVADAAADALEAAGAVHVQGTANQDGEEGDSTGTLTFSRFGEKEDISAPEDAIDLTEMMGGA